MRGRSANRPTSPIIIDEIRKAPELFEQIKIMCDETEERGLFWLTGSQPYRMMKNLRDMLAGRIGVLELYSFTKSEVDGVVFTDKLDFCDTGLCAYLSMWLTRDSYSADKATLERSNGGIVCMCKEVIPIDPKNCFIPCNLI